MLLDLLLLCFYFSPVHKNKTHVGHGGHHPPQPPRHSGQPAQAQWDVDAVLHVCSHLLILAAPFLVCLSVSCSRFIFEFWLFSRYSRVIKRSKFVVYVCVCVVAFLHDCLMCQVRHCFIYQCDIVHLFLPLSLSLPLIRY